MYKQNKDGSIVISGFEKGIADSPELGLGDMRSVNLTSIPGEASVSFSTSAASTPPSGQTGLSYSAAASTDVFTVSSTAGYYPGMAVKLDSVSTTNVADILLIAGGGGGGDGTGGTGGGGGGAGGFVSKTSYNITNLPGTFTVTVGAGGTGSTSGSAPGGNGGNSSIGSDTNLVATGGGGGGSASSTGGQTGGSGGGASANGGSGGALPAGQGNVGGNGASGGSQGSGGGGASVTGFGATGTINGAAGGNGTSNSISGSAVTYAGGGGGGGANASGTGGVGGTGGGGTGGTTGGTGSAGTANRGGGGGGGSPNNVGGAGGTGIVVISYVTGTFNATGGTITTSGGRTIHTFTTTGSWVVTSVNPSAGAIYYAGNITGTTFKLYYDPGLANLVDILTDITGTYDVPSFGTPVWAAQTNNIGSSGTPTPFTFLMDTNVSVWYLPESSVTGTGGTVTAGSLQYMGNVGHSSSFTNADFGLVLWKGYLFVFVGTSIDYLPISAITGATSVSLSWVYNWQPNSSTPLSKTTHQHQAIPATDDAVYICNGSSVASLLENVSSTFNPTNASSYTFNSSALALPTYDQAQCLAQLGPQLLVGGILSYIYPWDRTSTSFGYPVVCADQNIVRLVSTNSNTYAFAGTRGRIYITNGVQIQLYQKIPDSISGAPEPYYTWGDAVYLRNKIYFTFTVVDNAGNSLNSTGGFWCVGIDNGQTQVDLPTAGSLFNSNQLSYGTYGGSCPVLFMKQLATPPGYGLCGAWVNSGVNGVDIASSIPYTNYQTYIDTDLVPIGTFFEKKTSRQVEYKLSKPLVSGESVRISYRLNLTDNFTVIWTSATTGQVSDANPVNFEKAQWVQFHVELASTASNPSYTRLTQLMLH